MEFAKSLYHLRTWAGQRSAALAFAAFLIALARRYPLVAPLAAYVLVNALTYDATKRIFTKTPDFDTTGCGNIAFVPMRSDAAKYVAFGFDITPPQPPQPLKPLNPIGTFEAT